MPWVTFKIDFDWRIPNAKSRTTIAYKAGSRVLVKQACADDAKAAGAFDESAVNLSRAAPSPRAAS